MQFIALDDISSPVGLAGHFAACYADVEAGRWGSKQRRNVQNSSRIRG
jgi:hypothetical protein